MVREDSIYTGAEGLALRYINIAGRNKFNNNDEVWYLGQCLSHNRIFSYGFIKQFVKDFEDAYYEGKFPQEIEGRELSNVSLAYSNLLFNYVLLKQRAMRRHSNGVELALYVFADERALLQRFKEIEKTIDAIKSRALRIRPAKRLELEKRIA